MLPVFNLPAAIEEYNQINSASHQLNANETFGFEFFDAELLENLAHVVASIGHGVDKDFYTNDEKEFIEMRKRFKEKGFFKEIALKQVSYYVELVRSLNAKNRYRTWLKYQRDQLNDEENWPVWQLTTEAVAKLQEKWQAQQVFACHTNAALLEASELLEALIRHYRKAADALNSLHNQWRIPRPIYKAYQEHLQEFLNEAFAARQQIAASMMARLQAYDAKQPNVIAHQLAKLEQGGAVILHHYLPLPLYKDPLTDQQIVAYQNYAWNKGAEETRKSFRKISWFTDSSVVKTVGFVRNKAIQLVPTNLRNEVPAKKRKPAWLYKGHNIRHEFFKDKVTLLIHLNQSPNVDHFNLDLQNPDGTQAILDEIHNQENFAHTALLELDDQQYQSLSPFFQQKTIAFLAEWKNVLLQHQALQIENKIRLAEKIASAMSYQYQDNFELAMLAWESCNQLNNLFEELEQAEMSPVLRQRIDAVKENVTQLLKVNRIIQSIQEIAKGHILSQDEQYFLKSHLDALPYRDEQQYKALLCLIAPARKAIYENVTRSLQHFFAAEQPSLIVNKIECLHIIAKRYATAEQKTDYQNKIRKFFLRYLEVITKELNDEHDLIENEHIAFAGTLLKALGKEVSHTGETLLQRMAALREVAHNPYLLKAKCLTYLIELSEIYLMKRWKKESQQFQENIEDYIRSLPLGYEEVHLKLLTQIRERAVQTHKSLETLPLKKSEQKLAGLMEGETAQIKPLLEASIHAQRADRIVQDADVPLVHKYHCLRSLNLRLNMILAGTEEPLTKRLLKCRSGKHFLFSKTAIDPLLLPEQAESSTSQQLTSS